MYTGEKSPRPCRHAVVSPSLNDRHKHKLRISVAQCVGSVYAEHNNIILPTRKYMFPDCFEMKKKNPIEMF